MVVAMNRLGSSRYVGDKLTKLVHDRWHPESRGCSVERLVHQGAAVGFDPDTLDASLLEGYELCPCCGGVAEPGRRRSSSSGGSPLTPLALQPGLLPPSARELVPPGDHDEEEKRNAKQAN